MSVFELNIPVEFFFNACYTLLDDVTITVLNELLCSRRKVKKSGRATLKYYICTPKDCKTEESLLFTYSKLSWHLLLE